MSAMSFQGNTHTRTLWLYVLRLQSGMQQGYLGAALLWAGLGAELGLGLGPGLGSCKRAARAFEVHLSVKTTHVI